MTVKNIRHPKTVLNDLKAHRNPAKRGMVNVVHEDGEETDSSRYTRGYNHGYITAMNSAIRMVENLLTGTEGICQDLTERASVYKKMKEEDHIQYGSGANYYSGKMSGIMEALAIVGKHIMDVEE